jgi:hypothetical protein
LPDYVIQAGILVDLPDPNGLIRTGDALSWRACPISFMAGM